MVEKEVLEKKRIEQDLQACLLEGLLAFKNKDSKEFISKNESYQEMYQKANEMKINVQKYKESLWGYIL